MRYTKEFKLECVRKYMNGEHIPDPGGCTHRTFYRNVLRWVKIFNQLGEIGLEHKKPPISSEQKLALINRVIQGESYCSVAYSIGRQESYVSRIYKLYLQEGIDGLQSHCKKGRPSKMKKRRTEYRFRIIISRGTNQNTEETARRKRSRGKISKKISRLGSKEEGPTTKEKVSVVDELRLEYKLCVILKAAHIAKSTYEYYKESKHLKAEEKRKSKDNEILSVVKPIYEENKSRYGYRRVILSIDSKILSKLNVGRDRIRKVLRDNGLLGI